MRSICVGLAVLFACGALWGQQAGNITIDKQEWRDAPSRHFYIHGVMNGDTAFQVRLPEKQAWEGRLIQYLEGASGGSEKAGESIGEHAYALANGAAYVESSQGHTGRSLRDGDTVTELAYEASYAAVQYAKARCVEIYGREPDHTYIYGQSAGGMRASGMLERFPKVYDGAVPFVGVGPNTPLWQLYSLFELYRPVIQPKASQLADATRPGGSGDPFRALSTPEEKLALERILRLGYPMRQLDQLAPSIVSVQLLDAIAKTDPEYFADFWKKPGYLGASGELKGSIVENVEGEVKAVDARKGLLATTLKRPSNEYFGFSLRFTSGALAGSARHILGNQDIYMMVNPFGFDIAALKPGDTFVLDNRDLLAWREYYRYLGRLEYVAIPELPAATEKRPDAVLALMEERGRTVGRFRGKMIAVFSCDDQYAWPAAALNYRRRVEGVLGAKTDQSFRLYLLERTPHNQVSRPAWEVQWHAPMHKAMDDLMQWVEKGIPPAKGTAYSVDKLNQVRLAAGAARGGCQPVASFAAKGGKAEAVAGEAISFEASAEDPDNDLARFEVDFEGDGKFDESKDVSGRKHVAAFQHAYPQPGTYFAVLRVTDSTRSKGSSAPGIQNLAHVRVVVK